ncbi:MAG: hypothetical protein WCO77_06105 [bacterium]
MSCAILTVVLNCVSCASMLQSIRLPVTIRILDAETSQPVPGAKVDLQWRSGFQGYYWGRSVIKNTDTNGVALFASVDVPPISEDGYSLGKSEIRKLFISAVVVSVSGYEKTAVKYPEPSKLIEVRIRRAKSAQESPQPNSGP